MEKIRSILLLNSGENITGTYKTKSNDMTWSGFSDGEKGYLILTNQRLLFYKKKGILSESFELKNFLNLKDILDIAIGGTLVKHVSINGLKYYLDGANIESFCNFLRNTVNQIKAKSPETGLQQQQVHQIVNVNVVPQTIPQPLLEQKTANVIYCTQCGFPNDDISNFCKKCGSKISKI